MTIEEAIAWIKSIKDKYIHGGDDDFDEKRKKSLDMAIEALKVDTVEWKIGDHVKFKTNGRWYNTGVIEDIDEDSCLVKIEYLGGFKSPSLNAPDRVRLPLYKLMRR